VALAHCTLAVRDVRGTSHFLAEVFGWRPIERPVTTPFASAWLEVASGQEVHLAEIEGFEPSPFEGEYGRHIAVTFPRDQYAAVQERLRARGVEVMPPKRPSPTERFFFRDPNGYVFEVVAVA
jgi:catechol 2,3-dioxygenase-like lactoylglutathione lyase family enzyme